MNSMSSTRRVPQDAVASLLLLGSGESAVERTTFRSLGVARIQKLTSGRDALACLAAPVGVHYPELVVCEERLTDMNGIEFLCQLRSLPEFAPLPVVFLSGGAGPLDKAAENSRSCAVLRRPYTRDDVTRAFMAARTPELCRAPLPLPEMLIPRELSASARAAAAPQVQQAPERDLFQAGFASLRAGDLERARALLIRCYTWDTMHAEACLALARLDAGENRPDEARAWIAKAGIALLRRGDIRKASDVLARLPKGELGSGVLLTEAAKILREEEFTVAARLFIEAHRMNPQTPMHAMVSRCCLFTPAPQKALEGLCSALERIGHASTAARLRLRLSAPDPAIDPAESESFLERFPRLYDIVNVASHTFTTWRRAV